jgi:biotin-dependent carboxylase-like uncharacterized protein
VSAPGAGDVPDAGQAGALATLEALEILRAGLCTTVQDLGRPGHGRLGVSPSGAMDPWAHRLANRLLGNDAGAAALELTGPGVEITFLAPCAFALAGADLGAALDGRPLPAIARAEAAAGARLVLAERRAGARATLAVAGGLAVQAVLGSAATDLGGGLGGAGGDGRPLRAGQRLHRRRPGAGGAPLDEAAARAAWDAVAGDLHARPRLLRFIPEDDAGVPAAARRAFAGRVLRLSARAGRTGYRFEGPPLPAAADPARLSEPTAPGAIQLPPDGLPILLLADRNTTGGYPRLGHLAAIDVTRAAQLWPGDEVAFHPITAAEATQALRAAEAMLARSLLQK